MKRVDLDAPDVEYGYFLLYRGELFTGEVTEYIGDQLVSLDHYTDGVLNGLSRAWHVNGTLESEGFVRMGFPVGEWKEWHANGVLASRKVFSGTPSGVLEVDEWDENGRVTKCWHRSGG
ncbi:toxin-antitoxin system YwqK family antitoxin [Streptomyces gamaensis]|uniref:Toxin-antitoxin system YwqK family antitoxin n=1 Tax=Streptomyces gamaensis TaxID=1763542 RepID=A0ABW0Z0N5_9ACTN